MTINKKEKTNMTNEEKAIQVLERALKYKKDIALAYDNSKRYLDYEYLGRKSYVAMKGHPELEAGVRLNQPKIDYPKLITHKYQEYLERSPAKKFVLPLILGIAGLVIGLNIAFYCLLIIIGNGPEKTIGFVGLAFAAIFVIAGLIALLIGLSGKKSYSKALNDNKQRAIDFADSVNKKELEQWQDNKKEIDKKFYEQNEVYQKQNTLFESIKNEYFQFIKDEDEKFKRLKLDYSDFVSTVNKGKSWNDSIPEFVFDDEEYIKKCLKALKKDGWSFANTMNAIEDYYNRVLENDRESERAYQEERRAQEERNRIRDEYHREQQMRREREREEERTKKDNESAGRQLCESCDKWMRCRMANKLKTPFCGGFRPR